jgi:hypothetical protein
MSTPSAESDYAVALEALLISTGLPVKVTKREARALRGTIDALPFKVSWRKGAEWRPGYQLWFSVGGVSVASGGGYGKGQTPTVTEVQQAVQQAHSKARRAEEERQTLARRKKIEDDLRTAVGRAGVALSLSESDILDRAVTFAIAHGFVFEEDQRRQGPAAAPVDR